MNMEVVWGALVLVSFVMLFIGLGIACDSNLTLMWFGIGMSVVSIAVLILSIANLTPNPVTITIRRADNLVGIYQNVDKDSINVNHDTLTFEDYVSGDDSKSSVDIKDAHIDITEDN